MPASRWARGYIDRERYAGRGMKVRAGKGGKRGCAAGCFGNSAGTVPDFPPSVPPPPTPVSGIVC